MENSRDKKEHLSVDKLSEWREAMPQIIAVCVKNMLLLGFGMTLGFPTILIPAVSGNDRNETIILGQDAVSWIGSINLICVPIGCLLSGSITHSLGRKKTMQLVNFPFVAAWLLFYFSTEVWQIFLASCMNGLSGGLLEAPVLTYVAEITQPHLRGILSTTSTMAVVFGILSQFILGTFFSWRTVSLINCAAPIIAFLSLMFIPETPIWLITKNRLEDAKKSIAWLRGWTSVENIENEFQELHKQNSMAKDDSIKKDKLEAIKLFGKRNFVCPYLLITLAFFLGHFNGNTPLQAYAIKIFKALEAPLSEYYSTMIMGLVQLLGVILSVSLISCLGKRLINFISLFGSGICCLIVGSYAYINDINYLDTPIPIVSNTSNATMENTATDSLQWISVTFLVISAFLTYFGIKVLPWILIGEIYHNKIRATASGLSAGTGYIIGFLANKFFLDMVNNFTLPGVFWFYGSVGVFGTVLLYFVLPETEGKSLFEITEHFAGGDKLRRSVRRKKLSGNINNAFEPEDMNGNGMNES